MKRKLRDIAANVIGYFVVKLGFVDRAIKKSIQNGYITGIYFHNPGKKLFEQIISRLKLKGFTFLTIAQLEDFLEGTSKAPEKAMWISLDDGWADNMQNVLPFAVKNNVPLTFYIATEAVEESGYYWWSLAEKYRHLLDEPFRGEINKLWEVTEAERKQAIESLKAKLSKDATGLVMEREAMTIDDVKKLAQNELITIGSHTVNHVIAPNCTDEELEYELSESKKKLEEWTGRKIDHFCFPNGDLSGREETLLKKTGYRFAAAAENEFIAPQTEQYRITRFSVGDGYFYEELCHCFGVWQSVIKKLKK